MNLFRNVRQHVVPRWLTYSDATKTGELDVSANSAKHTTIPPKFVHELEHFRIEPSVLLASDLLGRALLLGHEPASRELAEFLIRDGTSPAVTLDVARSTLGLSMPRGQLITPPDAQIKALKGRLKEFPADPMLWVDLARCYTVLNQDDKAERAIRVALSLAPSDRFCIRAAARFFMHRHDTDNAYNLFRKRRSLLHDPWIYATAISTALWAGKPSLGPTKQRLASLVAHPEFAHAELIEACAFEEFSNGGDRMAKKAVRAALAQPSVNAVAHAEWFTRVHFPGLVSAVQTHAAISSAAEANRLFFTMGDPQSALAFAESWMLEEPYSSAPFVHASYLASVMEKHDRVVKIVEEAGRRRITNHVLVNNAIYSLIQLGRMSEAKEVLEVLIERGDADRLFSIKATSALYRIRSGDLLIGRSMYDEAARMAETDQPNAVPLVKLHKLLALAQSGIVFSDQDSEEMRRIEKANPDIPQLIVLTKIRSAIERRLKDQESKLSEGPVQVH